MRDHSLRVLTCALVGWWGCGEPGGFDGNVADPPDESTTTQQVFTNSDFESDAIGVSPTGWTITSNLNPQITDTRPNPQTLASLNLAAGGALMTFVVGGATDGVTDPDIGTSNTFRYPKIGNRAVRVNYQNATTSGKNRNVNSMRQTMTVGIADVDPFDNKVHVRFTVAPVLENPAHNYTEQPYYFVRLQNITKAATIYQDFATAGQLGVPWKTFTDASGLAAEYVDWSLVDIAPGNNLVAVGDQVELLVIAAGCSRGGHWGRIYVDSFGQNIPTLYTWADGPAAVNAGGNITYRINYRNGNSSTAYNTKVEFTTPPTSANTSTTFVSTNGPSCTTPNAGSSGKVTCTIGTLGPGADGFFNIVVNVPVGTANNTVVANGNYVISADNVSPLIGSRITTLVTTTQQADVRVAVTDDRTQVNWGETPVRYVITVTNTSSTVTATSVNVTDTFPAQLVAPVPWTCSATAGGTCTAAGSGNLNDTISLPPGAVATYIANGTMIAGSGTGTLRNTATATVATQTDPDTTNNAGVDTTAIGAPRVLTVEKLTAAALGTIRSEPAGLLCGTSCTSTSTTFADAEVIKLVAAPATGATFVEWLGACTGSGACNLTMSSALTVQARFAGPPASAALGGGGQQTAISTAFTNPLTVTITDSAGTPVPSATVTFAVPGAGASATLSTLTAVTNTQGVASVTATANATPGPYSVTATTPGIATPISFALSNLGPPTSIAVDSGAGQSSVVGVLYALPLIATVLDAANQPVPNASVTFTAPPTSGPTVTPASTTLPTNAAGQASLGVTAHEIAGSFNVTATVPGVLGQAVFGLTNLPGAGVTIRVVSGSPQSTAVADPFAAPFVVELLDQFGNPVPNQTLTFTAPPNTGPTATLSAPALTDSQGRTSVTGTAGTISGPFQITASFAGATSATFDATLLPGPADRLELDGGNNQTPIVDSPFGTPLSVIVRDLFGNVVPNVNVAFSAPTAGPRADVAPMATTNPQGIATVTPIAGQVAGTYSITASVGALTPLLFTVTNLPGPPAKIFVSSGDGQSTTVGTSFGVQLVALVTDAFDNPVSGGSVTFDAPSSGGASTAFATPSSSSNSAGLVSTVAIANTTTGSYTASATLAGLGSVSYNLTNTAAAGVTIVRVSGSPQSAPVATGFGAPLIVEVHDQYGNLAPGAAVSFTAPAGGVTGSPSAPTATSDSSGLAQVTVTAGSATGDYEITAALSGSEVRFALTNTAGAPALITVVSGSGQDAVVDAGFTAPLVVVVRDSFGNLVPGATVEFTAPNGEVSATLAAPTATTDPDGRAESTATARTLAGTYAITAAVAGVVTPASFTLTNKAGTPTVVEAITGGGQSTQVGTPFGAPLVVELRDQHGNPVPGVVASFAAPDSGPSAGVPATATTGSDGHAQVNAIAGGTAGSYDVVASFGAVEATFALTNIAGPATTVSVASGGGQTATVNVPFGAPLVVLVTDSFGNPLTGINVTLTAPDTSGPTAQLTDVVLTTGADGRASTTARAGLRAGNYAITATINGTTSISLPLRNIAGPPAIVRAVPGGSPQSGTVLTAFAAPLEVVVEDEFNNPVVGTEVVFAAPATGASATFAPIAVMTDTAGRAQVAASANGVSGSYVVSATVGGVDPEQFALSNTAGSPTLIAIAAGNAQTTVVDSEFPIDLDVLVTDAQGNPAPNTTVTFNAPAGGATGLLDATSIATDATGHAVVGVRASLVAGGYSITATVVGGAAPATFALTNAPDAPVTLRVAPTSTPQSATIGTSYVGPLVAIVVDQFGNGVPGVTVTFTAPDAGATGELSATTALTDAQGRASVTIAANTVAGAFAVEASAPGIASATFTLTNRTGATHFLSIRSGSQQGTTVDTEFAARLVVRVQDVAGNPIDGEIVTFAIPGTGASAVLASPTAITNAFGEAELEATANLAAGTYEVVASTEAGATPVAFTLTNRPGAPVTATIAPASSPQAAKIGHGFAAPLVIIVTDAFGNRVPGVEVTFAAPASGPRAAVSSASVITGPDGAASTLAVAGVVTGAYTVTASVTGIVTQVEITLTNTAGNPSSVVAIAGAGQRAMATTSFVSPVTLRVIDDLGNAIPNVTVMLSVPSSGPSGTLSATTATSNEDGLITVSVVANGLPGAFDVTVVIGDGAAPVGIGLAIDPIPTSTAVAVPEEQSIDDPLIASVRVTSQLLVPIGQVELLSETGKVLGSGQLNTSGVAQIQVELETRGRHPVSARYRAQAAFGASSSTAVIVDATQDRGRLTGAGSDACSAGGGRGGLGVLVVIGAALLAVRRRRRIALAVVAVAAIGTAAAPAAAQPAGSRAISRLYTAPADSEWFSLDSVTFLGHNDVSFGVTGDYNYRPLVVYNADESRRIDIVKNQFTLHFAGAVSIFERYRLSAVVPMAPYQDGSATRFDGMPLPSPTYAFGDVRIALDARLYGTATSALRIAGGLQLITPTGSKTNYMSDGIFAVDAHVIAGGTSGWLEYAVDGRVLVRESTTLVMEKFGSELRYGAALGVRLDGGRLVVGPELTGALPLVSDSSNGNPVEIGGGAHYRVGDAVRIGLGGTLGLVHAVGTPEQRIMLSVILKP